MAGVQTTGSPPGEPAYLVVGFLRRPHGVAGEILMELHTDFPEQLKPGRKLFLGDEHRPFTLAAVRPHGNRLLISLKGIETPEAAGRFRNTWVFARTKDLPPLPEGRYYQYQLLGLRVVDEDGKQLGTLTEVLKTGANDVYVVTGDDGRELLLPAIPEVILAVRLEEGLIQVHVLEGL